MKASRISQDHLCADAGPNGPRSQNALEQFPLLAAQIEFFANAAIGLSLAEWDRFCAEVNAVSAVAAAARELIATGLRLTPDGLIVREKRDRTDPHYRLCVALEAVERREAAREGTRVAAQVAGEGSREEP